MASLLAEAATELAVQGGVVSSDQAFKRAVTEFEFAMELQKLRREDIRDLVELTVGRMDIYHLLGAVLLEFAVSFYCENRLLEDPRTSHWILRLFLISNICAVGYLLFAVWLAMHASVAAHSVGVRLLLNYTRITVPDPSHLREIQKSTRLLAQVGKTLFGGIFGTKEIEAPAATTFSTSSTIPSRTQTGGHVLKAPTAEGSAMSSGEAVLGINRGTASTSGLLSQSSDPLVDTLENFDVETHKRRFQQEQVKWLSYDAYARTCMALGINQMLQALSYYIVGPIASRTPSGAFISLIGVQVIAVLVLSLDAKEERGRLVCNRFSELWVVLVLQTLPPVIAGFMVFCTNLGLHPRVAETLVTPCFMLHFLWLVFLMRAIAPNQDMLPKRLRTVCYLDVLEPEQQTLAADRARMALVELQAAKSALREAVRNTVEEECNKGMLSATLRECRLLETKRARLEDALSEVRNSPGPTKNSAATTVILDAEQQLRIFTLWKEVPQAQARLDALRATKDWHGEDFESRCAEFETFCHDLDLGMSSSDSTSSGIERGSRRIPPKSVSTVISHVEVPDPSNQSYAEGSLWVSTEEGTHTFAATEGNSISLAELGESHSAWVESASVARSLQQSLSRNPHADEDPHGYGIWIPSDSAPSKALAWTTVKRFTSAVALMWAAALLMHLGHIMFEFEEHLPTMSSFSFKQQRASLNAHVVEISWPSPAPLFEVSAMHCNRSSLLVAGRFSSHVASRRPSTDSCVATSQACTRIDSFAEVVHKRQAALSCKAAHCHVLTKAEDSSAWTLHSTWKHNAGVEERVSLPSAWRVVSLLTGDCKTKPCEEMWVAGWDGSAEIVIGNLRKNASAQAWYFQRRFALRPDLGRCVGGVECLAQGPLGKSAYRDVRSLHLGLRHGRRALVVLLASGSMNVTGASVPPDAKSYIDAWDLEYGQRLGRWRLDHGYTSMCLDGREILLARRAPDGPRMAVALLPDLLREDVAYEEDVA